MQKLIFLRIGLVLNLLEDAAGLPYAIARALALGGPVRSTTLDAFHCDFLYLVYQCLE